MTRISRIFAQPTTLPGSPLRPAIEQLPALCGLEDLRSTSSEAEMAGKRAGTESEDSGGDLASQETLAEDAGTGKQAEDENRGVNGGQGMSQISMSIPDFFFDSKAG